MSTFSDANNRRPSKFFEAVDKSLYEKFGRFLPDSRNYEWAQKLYVMDSTTISLFSNVLKGAGRNPKIGRKNGGIKSHTIMKALTGVPEFIRHTAARVHDHVINLGRDDYKLVGKTGQGAGETRVELFESRLAAPSLAWLLL